MSQEGRMRLYGLSCRQTAEREFQFLQHFTMEVNNTESITYSSGL